MVTRVESVARVKIIHIYIIMQMINQNLSPTLLLISFIQYQQTEMLPNKVYVLITTNNKLSNNALIQWTLNLPKFDSTYGNIAKSAVCNKLSLFIIYKDN
jgi:hypothetical protein